MKYFIIHLRTALAAAMICCLSSCSNKDADPGFMNDVEFSGVVYDIDNPDSGVVKSIKSLCVCCGRRSIDGDVDTSVCRNSCCRGVFVSSFCDITSVCKDYGNFEVGVFSRKHYEIVGTFSKFTAVFGNEFLKADNLHSA